MFLPLPTGHNRRPSCVFVLFCFNLLHEMREKAIHLTGVGVIPRKSGSHFRVLVYLMSNEGKQAKVQVFFQSRRYQDACSSLPSSLVKDWEVPDALTAAGAEGRQVIGFSIYAKC